MKILLIGAGYVGKELLKKLKTTTHEVSIATTSQEKIEELKYYGQSVFLINKNHNFALDDYDAAIILVAPKNSENYKETYLQTAENIYRSLEGRQKPFYILYTSSTSVYEGKNGWVEEDLTLSPLFEKAQILLATENKYLSCPTKTCILRLGGIYGPGRDLIDRVKYFSGKDMPGDGSEPTNHSHLTDIVNALLFCFDKSLTGIYNLTQDDHPTRKELYSSLCKVIDAPHPKWSSQTPQHTYKASNQKIKNAGFVFQYAKLLN